MLVRTATTAALLAAAAIGLWAAGDGPLDRATLKGLRSVSIVVEPLGPQLESQGVTREELAARLELALRDSGLTVDPNALEFAGLRISSAQGRRTDVALAVSLGLYQPVTLVRNKDTRTATDTWGAQSVVLAPPKQVREAVAETVELLARQLADAYRAVNAQ